MTTGQSQRVFSGTYQFNSTELYWHVSIQFLMLRGSAVLIGCVRKDPPPPASDWPTNFRFCDPRRSGKRPETTGRRVPRCTCPRAEGGVYLSMSMVWSLHFQGVKKMSLVIKLPDICILGPDCSLTPSEGVKSNHN